MISGIYKKQVDLVRQGIQWSALHVNVFSIPIVIDIVILYYWFLKVEIFPTFVAVKDDLDKLVCSVNCVDGD